MTISGPDNDRMLFAKTSWMKDASHGVGCDQALATSASHIDHFNVCQRTAYFYIRQLCRELSQEEIPSLRDHFCYPMDWSLNYLLLKIDVSPYESRFFHLCIGVIISTNYYVLAVLRASLFIIKVLPKKIFYFIDNYSKAKLLQYTLKTILNKDFFYNINIIIL